MGSKSSTGSALQVQAAKGVAEQQRQALELRLMGGSYDRIAKTLGVERRRVGELIRQALKEIPQQAVGEYRKAECERLDRLAIPYWPRALAGENRATLIILKIEELRVRVLGLEVKKGVGDGIGELAKNLPPGARLSVENLGRVWADPGVLEALQRSFRGKGGETVGAIETTAAAITVGPGEEALGEDGSGDADEDARLYAEAAAKAGAE